MKFKDHFSGHAGDYARYRPDYPDVLFEFLAKSAKAHELAWDCGTGNGQAALGLAGYFDRVIATDPSQAQIRNAVRHKKIEYFAAPAEQTEIPSRSVDLITVAQALHWFRFDAFYQEASRVLKPDGLLAVWCYGLSRINPDVDKVVHHYYKNIVGPYWPAERHYIDEKYRTIPFPFLELPTPEFYMKAEWNMNDMIGYLHTWSATQRCQRKNEQNPIDIVRRALARAWGPETAQQTVRWPIYLRLGRMIPEAKS
ncbi:MAG: class I SAM-dependent methyltransferase [Gammaproteobacteria bacterium]|nr:class I SAM-dependent methyltransferase [Gammaproteobacteria bacterium]